jgi:AraC family transcriptional regulator
MIRHRLASTSAEITRILKGTAPPLIPQVFSGDTRLTRRWRNDPFEANVRPMQHHIVVAKFAGDGCTWTQVGRKVHSSPSAPGTVTLVPRGQEGYRRMDGVAEASSIFLGHDRLATCAEQLGNGHQPELLDRSNIRDPKLFAIMKLLSDEIESGEPMSHLFTEQLLDLLCLQLLRSHSAFPLPASQLRRGGLAGWQIKRVTAYMRENLATDIALQELADLANLSRFHFCAAFRGATGRSPYEWLTAQRIAHARTLLADRRLSIADIALAVGYQTPSAFAARFRRVAGLSPSEYRRRL